jgi:uncharacterized membrane protein YqiK
MHLTTTQLCWALSPVVLIALWHLLGITFIRELETGIVVKRWSWRNLPPGQIIALNGEAGIQADTLPPGLHFFYWIWQYTVTRTQLVEVPQDHIALVVAHAGEPIPPGRILGRRVDCDHFQDARAFLTDGGEKGRQNAVLTAGTYRINTDLFDVITPWTCASTRWSQIGSGSSPPWMAPPSMTAISPARSSQVTTTFNPRKRSSIKAADAVSKSKSS